MAFAIYLLFLTTMSQIIDFTVGANEPSFEISGQFCWSSSNETIPINYQNNVNQLVSLLVSKSASSHSPQLSFFNTSVGDISTRAYGYYLCRGDLSAKKCHNCLETAHESITGFIKKIGYNCFVDDINANCLVHYANSSKFLGFGEGMEIGFTGGGSGDSLRTYSEYNKTLSNAMQELFRDIRYENVTNANFATRVVEVPGSHEKIYLLVQCRPDMPPINCSECLSNVRDTFLTGDTTSGKVLGVNCLLKYSNQTFFGSAYHRFMPNYLHFIVVLLLTVYLIILM